MQIQLGGMQNYLCGRLTPLGGVQIQIGVRLIHSGGVVFHSSGVQTYLCEAEKIIKACFCQIKQYL
jgi:hypothetical protein